MADTDFENHLNGLGHLKDLAQREFVRAMRTDRMIAFVGSYASEQFKYPNWGKFLTTSLDEFSKTTPPEWVIQALSSLEEKGQPKIENFELLRT
jgi:hypothetical protein